MKTSMAFVLSLGILLNILISPAEAENFLEGLGGAVSKIYALMTKNQIILYTTCAGYYAKFNKWPSSEKELEDYFTNVENEGGEKARDILDVLNGMELDFMQLDDGSMLIEGRYKEEVEKEIEKTGLGKFRISVIGRRTQDGFSFLPSDKSKGNRDYFNFPMNMNVKEEDTG
ncbi:MAG: hypothetical protein A2Z72_03385 [Omnitrophica bacterium RBG_13_46_9]|nr:MAG: hypothetical protein A2Z72_03385 [Omnitrophica bacterium RBG_13_46_9]